MMHNLDDLTRLRIDREARIASSASKGAWSTARLVSIAVLFLAVSAAGVFFWRAEKHPEADVKQVSAPNLAAPPSTTALRLPVASKTTVLEANGYVRARRRALVAPRIGGQIVSIHFDIGDRVQAGQVLAELDSRYAQIELRQAEHEMRYKAAVLAENKLALAQAERALARASRLHRNGHASDKVLDDAKAEVEIQRARVAGQEQVLDLAQAKVDLQREQLGEYEIRAPFAGVITKRDVSKGQFVTSGITDGYGGAGGSICALVDLERLDVEVDVSEKYIHRISPGQKTALIVNDANETEIAGRVHSIIPSADRGRATLKVRIEITGTKERLLPDMGIRARFLNNENPSPEAANDRK